MKKRIRIKDIADKAGVSTGTVDRVLHDRGNVAPDVKSKVLEVAKELGYERNRLASALAYNRTIRVATLLPNPEKDPYWKQTNFGIQKALKAVQHYGLLSEQFYFNLFSPKSFIASARQALEKKPRGILFPPIFSQEAHWLLDQCKEFNIPTVIINTNIKEATPLCYIGQDSYQSGVLGARLLNFGLTSGQTCCILNIDFNTKTAHHLLEKERGFRDYFVGNGNKQVEIIRKDFEGFNDRIQLCSFLKKLIREHHSLHGIFVTTSRTHKVADCLHEITDRKIKIVGFDLIDANLKYLQENKINFLINQNPAEQGFQGIMNLFKHLILKEKIEKIQYLPLDIVVKENAEYYRKRQMTFEIAI